MLGEHGDIACRETRSAPEQEKDDRRQAGGSREGLRREEGPVWSGVKSTEVLRLSFWLSASAVAVNLMYWAWRRGGSGSQEQPTARRYSILHSTHVEIYGTALKEAILRYTQASPP